MRRAEQLARIIEWFEANVHRCPSLDELKQLCVNKESTIISLAERANLGIPIPERSYYDAIKRLQEEGRILIFKWHDGRELIHLLAAEEKGMLEYFDESIKVVEDAVYAGYGDVGGGFKRLRCPICGLEAEWNENTKEFRWLISGPQGVNVIVGGKVPYFSISGVKVPSHGDCELYKLSMHGNADFKKLKEIKPVVTTERYNDALEYIERVSYSWPGKFEYVILLLRLDDKILPLLEKMARTGNPIYIDRAAYILRHILLNFRGTQRYITVVKSVEKWLRDIFDHLIQLWDECGENYSLFDVSPPGLVSSILKCVMLVWDSGVDDVCEFIISHIERFDPRLSYDHAKAWRYFNWALYNPFDHELRKAEDLYVKLWQKRRELLNHPDPRVRDIAYYYMPRP
jgi:hypothetical protein